MENPENLALALNIFKNNSFLNGKNESKWFAQFLELVNYKKQYGNVDVPAKYPKNKSLGRWVRKQRFNHSINKLAPDRENLLVLIGFNFRLLNISDWDAMFSMLSKRLTDATFREIQPKTDIQLYSWVHYQRKLYWKGKLDGTKLKRLKEVGVDMKHQTLFRFEQKFNKLEAFQKINGHCYVCESYGADNQLINFCKGLRRSKDDLPEDKILSLDKIGFDWNPKRKATKILNRARAKKMWLERYNELCQYKHKFGHCFILTTDVEYYSLAQWNSKQRNSLHELSKTEICLLNDIGFFRDNLILLQK